MTNSQKLNQIRNKLDNWQELSLLEHCDLIINQLPVAISQTNYRPDDDWYEPREKSDFEKSLTDEHDYGI